MKFESSTLSPYTVETINQNINAVVAWINMLQPDTKVMRKNKVRRGMEETRKLLEKKHRTASFSQVKQKVEVPAVASSHGTIGVFSW